jgi:hypothetical protein
MYQSLQNIDHTALKVNQLTIRALVVLAFVFSWSVLVVGVALVMLLGALLGVPGFLPVYRYLLKPLRLARPHILPDNPEPHRFAQGLGGVFLAAASAALFLGASWLGWGLAGMVVFLAALNAFGGFCLGCFLYYWLGRLGLPGFRKQPPAGTFPGRAPLTSAGKRRQVQ